MLLRNDFLLFVMVFLIVIKSVELSKLVLELIEFIVCLVILDEVCRKLYCLRKVCFLLLSFLIVGERVIGIDNFFKILFCGNVLLILNNSVGCLELVDFFGK